MKKPVFLALTPLFAFVAQVLAADVAFPLKLSANHRYLVDQNDRPFRLNCEAVWMLSVKATAEEVDEYLDDRAAKGFSSFILMAMVHPGDFTGFAPEVPRNRSGHAPHERVGDFSSAPDEEYWKFIDSIIDAAARRQMAVVFAYTYLGYRGGNQGWWEDLQRDCNTQEVCFKWGAWLGRRYRDRTNIVWYTIGDYTPPAGSEGGLRTRKILEGIKSECPWALFGGEPSGCDQLTTDAIDVADLVDMNSFYGYGPDCDQRVFMTADRAWNHSPTMPAWVGEPVYYNEQITGFDTASGNRQDTRALQWQAVLAGGTAGDNTSTKAMWKFTTWRDDLNNGYAKDRQRLFAFFEAMPWYELVPSGIETQNFGRPIIMRGNPLDRRHIVAAATEDRGWLVAYTPPSPWVPTATRFFTVDMSVLRGPARARWFNPASGEFTLVAESLPNTEPHRFVTPGDNGTGTNDWVLVCDCAADDGSARAAADSLPASDRPPGGLAVAQAPQFVLLGFDDNPQTEPMTWIVDYLKDKHAADGTPARAIFFSNGRYWSDPALVAIHRRAAAEGHEIANHTQSHEHGDPLTVAQWRSEMAACKATFDKAGIPAAGIVGFRTPFLEHTAATFEALVREGSLYDSSLEEGFQSGQDGTNYLWPYTLEAGSPGNAGTYDEDSPRRVGSVPGLWEIPIYAFLIPSDEDCARDGIEPGLRARTGAALKVAYGHGSSEPTDRIGGADWNVFESANCTGPEFFAMLKLSLDRRLAGNRAPFMICGHTQLYLASKPDRRKAMEDFIDYALSKPEVRFVTGTQLIEWLRAPRPLAVE